MKEIRILHLYADTLDLYGDFFNLRIVCSRLREMGFEPVLLHAELDDAFDPEGADMIYIGHGKARSLAAVAGHFAAHSAAVCRAAEAGKLFLVTGNARLLFGKGFEMPDGRQAPGAGLFDYTGVETGEVFTADVVGRCTFDPEILTYGFVNRTQYIEGNNDRPLFTVLAGPGDGKEPDGKEGTLYQNFFGTWQMGPLLPRNPLLLREILFRLTGAETTYDDTLERKALEATLREFKL